MHTIEVRNPEARGREGEDYEIVGHKVGHRPAQRPGVYVVLEYVRPVVKRLGPCRRSASLEPGRLAYW